MSQQRSLELSLEELARRTGETPEQLLRWRSLRLIGAEDQEGFGPEDVESVRLIQLSFRRGINAETIARAEAEEKGFLRHYVDQLFPAGIGPTYSVAEAAAMVGLDVELVRRLREMVGAAGPREMIDAEDLEMLRGWKVALEAGLPEEALRQLVRVYAYALGRIAEAAARLFHFYVHERLREGGLSGLDLHNAREAAVRR